jgi:hypothetical protein
MPSLQKYDRWSFDTEQARGLISAFEMQGVGAVKVSHACRFQEAAQPQATDGHVENLWRCGEQMKMRYLA